MPNIKILTSFAKGSDPYSHFDLVRNHFEAVVASEISNAYGPLASIKEHDHFGNDTKCHSHDFVPSFGKYTSLIGFETQFHITQ